MRIRIGIQLTPRDLNRRLAQAGGMAREELSLAIRALGMMAQRRARRKAPVDTGQLRASIGLETKPLYAWVGSRFKYAAAMEEGAKPHWPPQEPIVQWVWRNRAKFGVVTERGRPARGVRAQRQVERIAFVVRRAIGRRGLKGHGYMKDAMEQVVRQAPRVVGKVARQIAIRLVSR